MFFHNKGIDLINLPRILHYKRVAKQVPHFFRNREPPIVSYSYPKTIANKIFNFRNVLEELDFNVGTSDMVCDCNTSAYLYVPVGHVVTGNLSIVRNRHVRQLLRKGPKFREQNNIDWDKNKYLCMKALRKYVDKWASKEKVDKRVLGCWIGEVELCIDEKIKYLKGRPVGRRKKQILRNEKHLKDFHNRYVLVPADKASNNIVYSCMQKVLFGSYNE